MLYFSLTTPTTTGCGDVVPVGPFEFRHRRAPLANGASHQTVWTGVIAGLIDIFGHLDAQIYLEGGRAAALGREKRR
jgi:hypothetical protein